MRIVKNFRRPTSIIVMVAFTFLICFWANQSPAAARAPAPEKGPAASLEKGGNGGTGFLEQEGSKPVVKKHKKFPWLLVGVGVVVITVIILVIGIIWWNKWITHIPVFAPWAVIMIRDVERFKAGTTGLKDISCNVWKFCEESV